SIGEAARRSGLVMYAAADSRVHPAFATRRSPDLQAPGRPHARARGAPRPRVGGGLRAPRLVRRRPAAARRRRAEGPPDRRRRLRSEEHTSELQSRENLVCRLPLEKKNTVARRTLP